MPSPTGPPVDPLPAAALGCPALLAVAAVGALVGLVLRCDLRRGRHRLAGERAAPMPRCDWLPAVLALAYAGVATSPGLRDRPLPVVAYLVAATTLAWLVAVDVDVRRLPNAVTLPAVPVSTLVLGTLSVASRDPPVVLRMLAGALALVGLYACLFAIGRRGHGLGLGDVKLAASLGQWLAWLGWTPLLAGAYLGLLFGGSTALVLLLTGSARRDSALPHAPAMALGAACGLWLAAPPGSG